MNLPLDSRRISMSIDDGYEHFELWYPKPQGFEAGAGPNRIAQREPREIF